MSPGGLPTAGGGCIGTGQWQGKARDGELRLNGLEGGMVVVPGDSLNRTREPALQRAMLRDPGVEGFSYSFAAPTDNFAWFSDFRYDHRAGKTPFGANLRWADTNYFGLYHLKLVAGLAGGIPDQLFRVSVHGRQAGGDV